MSASHDIERDGDPMSVQWLQDMAVFRFSNRPLFFSTDLGLRDDLLEALERCAISDEIKVVLLFGLPEKAGRGEYDQFFRAALRRADHLLVNRMLNVFNQFLVKIVSLSKPVIFVDGGRIISQFINVGLACDYRIISDDTVIEKAYLRHGMLPKGGGALFLRKLLGRSRAFQMLLSEDDVTAADALRLGLVEEVVPCGQLDAAGMAAARRFAAMPATTVSGVKKLLNYDLRELREYLEFENNLVLSALRKGGFDGQG